MISAPTRRKSLPGKMRVSIPALTLYFEFFIGFALSRFQRVGIIIRMIVRGRDAAMLSSDKTSSAHLRMIYHFLYRAGISAMIRGAKVLSFLVVSTGSDFVLADFMSIDVDREYFNNRGAHKCDSPASRSSTTDRCMEADAYLKAED